MEINRKYQIDRLKTNDENFPYKVNCMIKDMRGFMWFGTDHGLYRFDGYNFKIYSHKIYDKSTISGDNIFCICEENNYLWIGTMDGLNRFDKTTEQFELCKCDYVPALCLSRNEELWLLTREELNKLDKSTNSFFRYKNSSDNLGPRFLNSICEDREGDLWIGDSSIGLERYDIKNNKFTNYRFEANNSLSLSSDTIGKILEDKNGNIWIATYGGGINKLDKKKEIFYRYQHDPSNEESILANDIICMSLDEEQNLWCGTSEGISIFDTSQNKFINLHKNDNTSLSKISHIYCDYSGIVWIHNDEPEERSINLFSKNKRKFNFYKNISRDSNSIKNDRVISITEDGNGNLWIGGSKGIDILNKDKKKIRYLEDKQKNISCLIDQKICNIYRDKQNCIWLTAFDYTLKRYDMSTETLTDYHDFDGKGFMCIDIFEDKKENLWLGLFQGGVRVFGKNRELKRKYLTSENGYSKISILRIFEDNSENIWMATSRGLAMLDIKTDSIVLYKNIPGDINSISSDLTMWVIQDKKGYIWVSTRYGGLNRFDPETKTFKRYMKEAEAGFNSVFALLLDDNGNIWMTTEKSLSMFNLEDESLTNYNESDGIQGFSEYPPLSFGFVAEDGEMFFGGSTGFTSFYPDRIPKNKNVPTIVLTDFRVFNKEVKLNTSITDTPEIIISHKENFFSFGFAVLDFTNPGKNQYAYKLEGVDKDWNYVGNKMTASYTDISAGQYTFRVKGSNNDGIWNEEGISVKLIITPPWYKTIWFKGFAAVSLVSGAGFMYGQRIEKLKKGKRQQEEFSKKLIESQENERKRVAAELHDSLGQDLLIIKNKALISLKKADNVKKLKEDLSEISDLTSSTINEVREISYNLRPYELDRLGLIKTLQSLVDRASKSANITFICDIDNIDNIFSPEVEINIYRIIQECMTNIIKHSEATEVIIKVKKFEKDISILISDNGKGFDIEKNDLNPQRKGFGLTGIPERVKLFGGSFDIESEPGKGTKIKITLPFKS